MIAAVRPLGRRLATALAALFPSVPPAQQARILAAMEGRYYQAPEGEGASVAVGKPPVERTDPRPPAPDLSGAAR